MFNLMNIGFLHVEIKGKKQQSCSFLVAVLVVVTLINVSTFWIHMLPNIWQYFMIILPTMMVLLHDEQT